MKKLKTVRKTSLAGEIANRSFYDLKKQVVAVGGLTALEQERVRDIIRNAAMGVMNELDENIGTFLVRIGAMRRYQVRDVISLQKEGDTRMFGEIAVEFGYIDDRAIKRFMDTKRKK